MVIPAYEWNSENVSFSQENVSWLNKHLFAEKKPSLEESLDT
jgi:hypothetical protein